MSAHRLRTNVGTMDGSRGQRIYRARIVPSEKADIVVKGASRLEVGKRISFASVADGKGSAPGEWRSGVIWRIDKDCLHLTRT